MTWNSAPIYMFFYIVFKVYTLYTPYAVFALRRWHDEPVFYASYIVQIIPTIDRAFNGR